MADLFYFFKLRTLRIVVENDKRNNFVTGHVMCNNGCKCFVVKKKNKWLSLVNMLTLLSLTQTISLQYFYSKSPWDYFWGFRNYHYKGRYSTSGFK